MNTPVVLIIFNRPDMTERVFTEITKVKPRKLFVIADGPRPDRPDDVEKCAAARAVVERVDWDCEVFRDYSDVNLGCGLRPSTGITWVFQSVEKAIILEDDCVPDPTFFPYCEELLERYRDDERIMHIGGMHPYGRQRTSYSYYFSLFPTVWGWATWRRAWRHFDIAIRRWSELRESSWLVDMAGDGKAAETLRGVFDHAYTAEGQVDYWDYQWIFGCWSQHGLAAIPGVNLIRNIGFGPEATHTKFPSDGQLDLPTAKMEFPLRHPSCLVRDREADYFIINKQHVIAEERESRPSMYRRARSKISCLITQSARKAKRLSVLSVDP